jgi:hypothetical protein
MNIIGVEFTFTQKGSIPWQKDTQKTMPTIADGLQGAAADGSIISQPLS